MVAEAEVCQQRHDVVERLLRVQRLPRRGRGSVAVVHDVLQDAHLDLALLVEAFFVANHLDATQKKWR